MTTSAGNDPMPVRMLKAGYPIAFGTRLVLRQNYEQFEAGRTFMVDRFSACDVYLMSEGGCETYCFTPSELMALFAPPEADG